MRKHPLRKMAINFINVKLMAYFLSQIRRLIRLLILGWLLMLLFQRFILRGLRLLTSLFSVLRWVHAKFPDTHSNQRLPRRHLSSELT